MQALQPITFRIGAQRILSSNEKMEAGKNPFYSRSLNALKRRSRLETAQSTMRNKLVRHKNIAFALPSSKVILESFTRVAVQETLVDFLKVPVFFRCSQT